jgi:hypothetical protein
VDPFALAMLGLLVGLILLLVLAGKFAPGTGLEQVGWKTSREVMERREALDAEDVEQMVAARNARRRARGEREVSLEEVELQVMAEIGEQQRRSEQHVNEQRERQLADRDFDELLEATNARRRARGLPERTREEARREFGSESCRPPGSGS